MIPSPEQVKMIERRLNLFVADLCLDDDFAALLDGLPKQWAVPYLHTAAEQVLAARKALLEGKLDVGALRDLIKALRTRNRAVFTIEAPK